MIENHFQSVYIRDVHRARGGGRAARSLMPNLANILAAAPPKKNWRAVVARPRRLRLAFKFAAGRLRLDHISCQDFFKSNFENQSQIYCLSATFLYSLC